VFPLQQTHQLGENTMTQKLVCLGAALLVVFAVTNVVSAEEAVVKTDTGTQTVVTKGDCPCSVAALPPCCPPVVYRVGPFGGLRPVVYAPVYRPVYYPRYYRAWYPAPYCW
jgi:hypothetical protein